MVVAVVTSGDSIIFSRIEESLYTLYLLQPWGVRLTVADALQISIWNTKLHNNHIPTVIFSSQYNFSNNLLTTHALISLYSHVMWFKTYATGNDLIYALTNDCIQYLMQLPQSLYRQSSCHRIIFFKNILLASFSIFPIISIELDIYNWLFKNINIEIKIFHNNIPLQNFIICV